LGRDGNVPKPGQGSVRVVAGRFRGLRLATREGEAVRPTADRVKEALFSILGPRLAGAAVLDCFAGTGALGIEALSRGAARAAFLETDAATVSLLRRNLARLPNPPPHVVIQADVFRPAAWAAKVLPVDVILADPPYRQSLGERLLAALDPEESLETGGVLVLEHEKEAAPGDARWRTMDRRRYGDTVLSLFTP
jgi:16S rRNA (guanine966-N2)-methyltransferase